MRWNRRSKIKAHIIPEYSLMDAYTLAVLGWVKAGFCFSVQKWNRPTCSGGLLAGTHGQVQPGEPRGASCNSGSTTCHFLLKKKKAANRHPQPPQRGWRGIMGVAVGVSPGPEDILAQQFAKEL